MELSSSSSSSSTAFEVSLPERVDLVAAKEAAGVGFNETLFRQHMESDGCVPVHVFQTLLRQQVSSIDPSTAAERLRSSDADLREEAETSSLVGAPHPLPPSSTKMASRCPFAKLHLMGRTHTTSGPTVRLLAHIGGLAALKRLTAGFYKMAFANAHLKQFFRSVQDPHADRLAMWVAEKMGDPETPWTRERRTRDTTPVRVGGGHTVSVHDRSSAHVAAWYSPKRPANKVGQHFKLEDARLWMRLNFLAARQAGLFNEPNFQDWYVRFIAHFMRVYEREAPQFAREVRSDLPVFPATRSSPFVPQAPDTAAQLTKTALSCPQSARWSEKKSNVAAYLEAAAQGLPEALDSSSVLGKSMWEAVKILPPEERAASTEWPYEQ